MDNSLIQGLVEHMGEDPPAELSVWVNQDVAVHCGDVCAELYVI